MDEYWTTKIANASSEWERSLIYLNHHKRLDDAVILKIKQHIRKHGLSDTITAWYRDMPDFYSDWCDKYNCAYSKSEARGIYDEGICDGEFQRIKGYGILRYAI